MGEFELIYKYFKRPVARDAGVSVSVGIGDDGAVFAPRPGRESVLVVDTLVQGVHFPESFSAGDLGYRAVQVNLSDLAAMGATPRLMTLALTHPNGDEGWFKAFAGGFFEAGGDLPLIGGDTTRGREISVTVSILGDVAPGAALLRSGARPGDRIFVSGHLGDAAAGLRCLQSGADPTDDNNVAQLIARFRRPTARLALGAALVEVASACIDVSDGLLSDLRHVATASEVSARIDCDALPMSQALAACCDEAMELALAGGDDYELCFTAAAERADAIADIAQELGLPLTDIGTIAEGQGVQVTRGGRALDLAADGFDHFGGEGH